MTIKTFDPDRVGGGTFQLEQDSTGAYTIKEVGFVKLPDLKLPEIDQAAYTAPPDSDDDTTPDPCPPGFKLVDGVCQRIQDSNGGGGGGGQSQNFDYTGATQLTNIQDEATQLSKRIQTMVENQEAQERAAGISAEGTPLTTADVSSANQEAQELAAGIGPEKQFASQMIAERKAAQMGPGSSNPRRPGASFANNQKSVPEASQALDDEYYDFDRPANVGDFGGSMDQMSGAKVEDIGKKFLPNTGPKQVNIPEAAKTSALEKAKNLLDPKNSVIVKIASGIGTGLKAMEDALLGPKQVALNTSNKNALDSLGYKTNFELGISTDPGRIKSAINPDGSVTTSAIDNVFIVMNRTSATGNVMNGARKRVSTVQKTIDRALAKGDTAKAARFQERKDRYNSQIEAAQAKKNKADIATGGVAPGASGGGGGSGGGGKSIVCTAMYQTTGLQDWAKAMKIWYIYQKRYLTIQHQEGYHKLFKPFVKAMHKSNIIKTIGAHFAKHRTQHLKHVMFNSKPSLLGKIYNKVLEPICYWAGRK